MKNNIKNRLSYHQQKGAVTLLTAAVLVILMTLITVFASRVGLMEQRISANDARHKEAFSASEAGMENALRFIKHNKGLIETGVAAAAPYTNTLTATLSNNSSYSVTITASDVTTPIVVLSSGTSADGSGESDTQILVSYFAPNGLGQNVPDVPMITDGTATIGGSLEIVGNSNGAGSGIPVSVWSTDTISFSGAAGTCQLDGYLVNGGITPDNEADKQLCEPTNCTCSGTLDVRNSSAVDGARADIVDNDLTVTNGGNFPDDLFEYVFGVARADWKEIYDLAAVDGHVLDSCSSLDANSEGLFWIEGVCDISSNTIVGRMGTNAVTTKAVLIVVEDSGITLRGGAAVFGLIYSFDKNDDGNTGGIAINGSNIVYGAFIADTGIDISNGTLHVRYNRHILNSLFSSEPEDPDGGNFGGTCGGTSGVCEVGKVAGTWRDF
jgi:hypothetical protein